MTNQELIDKYLSEFNEIQKLKVPIELNSYLHRMLDEALRIHVVSQRSELLLAFLDYYHSPERGYNSKNTTFSDDVSDFLANNCA